MLTFEMVFVAGWKIWGIVDSRLRANERAIRTSAVEAETSQARPPGGRAWTGSGLRGPKRTAGLRVGGLHVDHALRDLRQLLIGLPFLVERLLEQVGGLRVAQLPGPR